jgi:hypothetical protein
VNKNDPVFIEMLEEEKPLNLLGDLAVSSLTLCAFTFIVSGAFVI